MAEGLAILGSYLLSSAGIIQMALTVASMLYQRSRAKKLAAKAADEADKQKGFQLTVEGESEPISVFYGRNKVGGTRVYHKVSGDFNFALPNLSALLFTSSGDSRRMSTLVSAVVASRIEYTNAVGTGQDMYQEYWDSGLGAFPTTVNSGGLSVTAPAGAPITAGQVVSVTHPLLIKKEDGSTPTEEGKFGYTVTSYNPTTGALELAMPSSVTSTQERSMGATVTGTKNEFLFVQQVLGHGGINDVYAVDINEKDWRDPYFGASARIHVDLNGGQADPMITANDAERANSLFTDAAYASMVFRLNRDEPQYSSVPMVQFYIEGMRVRHIEGTAGARTLSVNREYSNNPALCLLDYLTSTKYGRGLPVEKLDLDSFYNAYLICERTVMTGLPMAGKLWQEKGKYSARIAKLYECNLGLDTTKSIRENIEIMLETMGRAELVWSAGKYKLSLLYPTEYSAGAYNLNDVVQYPAGASSAVDLYRSLTNGNSSLPTDTNNWARDVVAGYITDNDIVREEQFTQSYPNGQTRLNYCTVKFLDESKDFAENTVSWPPKDGPVYPVYLAEDSQLPLEMEVFQTGDSTVYHALATAEERVRSSRASVIYTFVVTREFAGLEPGDIIRVDSTVLSIPGELMQVEEIKVTQEGNAKIQAVKYDARHLAWNAKDNEVVSNRVIYDFELAQATNLTFTDTSALREFTSGILSWTAAADKRVVRYIIGATATPATSITDETQWTVLGDTIYTAFDIPALQAGFVTLGVAAVDADGRLSPRNSPRTGSRWPVVDIQFAGSGFVRAEVTRNPIVIGYNADGTLNYTDAWGDFQVFYGEANVKDSPALTFSLVSSENLTGTFETTGVNKGRYTVTSLVGNRGVAVLKANYKGKDYLREVWVYNQPGISEAITGIFNAGNDNMLTKGEKRANEITYKSIVAYYSSRIAEATAAGITTEKDAMIAAYAELLNYLQAPYNVTTGYGVGTGTDDWRNVNTDSAINGATFRSKFEAAFNATEVLDTKILEVNRTNTNVAVQNANEAKSRTDAISNDNILAKGEKRGSEIMWNQIASYYDTKVAEATAAGITTEKTNFITAFDQLLQYLEAPYNGTTGHGVGLGGNDWKNVNTDSQISGTVWRSKFDAIYDAAEILETKLSAVNRENAAIAVTTAQEAELKIDNFANDNVLSRAEKRSSEVMWNQIAAYYNTKVAEATNAGITTEKTNFINAYTEALNYLQAPYNASTGYGVGLGTNDWNNPNTDSQINGATWRYIFDQVFDSSEALETKLSSVNRTSSALANTKADNAVSTANIADDNATSALSQVSNKLNKNGSDILYGAVTVSNAGGFSCGSMTWNSTGDFVGGSGVAMTAKGIVGANNGNVTFYIDNFGNSIFKGDLDVGGVAKIQGVNDWEGSTYALLVNASGARPYGAYFRNGAGGSALRLVQYTTTSVLPALSIDTLASGTAMGISVSVSPFGNTNSTAINASGAAGTGVKGSSSGAGSSGVRGEAQGVNSYGVHARGYNATGIGLFLDGTLKWGDNTYQKPSSSPAASNVLCEDGYWRNLNNYYSALGHGHNLSDIFNNGISVKFQYSTDNVNWVNIYMRRIDW